MFDMEKLNEAALASEPFPYVIVPGFVTPNACAAIAEDYPDIRQRGSFSLDTLQYGPAFQQLLDTLRGEAFRLAVEKKFSLNLDGRPTLITVRGMCGRKDGKIHTDTQSKIISLLLYMNDNWEKPGGMLRLLNSRNLEDVAAEVPPVAGTLLMFRRTDNSFHGHKLHIGRRRVVQMNWVTDEEFITHSNARHGWSSWIKKYNPLSRFTGQVQNEM